jgi:hypothetical protein
LPGSSFIVVITDVVDFLSRKSSIAKSEGVVGVEPNGFIVIGYGSELVPFVRIGESAVIKGKSVVGVQSNSFVVINNSSIVVAQIEVERAKPRILGRPCPLHRGHYMPRKVTRKDATDSKAFARTRPAAGALAVRGRSPKFSRCLLPYRDLCHDLVSRTQSSQH